MTTTHNGHSIPAILVQVPDIGYGVPGIQCFCNRTDHPDCCKELDEVLHTGGRVVRTSYWAKFYNKHDISQKQMKG